MSALLAFVIGIFIGGIIGLLITALIVGAHDCAETLPERKIY
jgi:hypothetical protein